jgi:hypothetical protein
MMRWCLGVFVLLWSATSGYSQVASHDKLPPTSSCKVPYPYEHGVNMSIAVFSESKDLKPDLETAIAQNISRFKDTAQIRTSLETQKTAHQLEFYVFITATRLLTGDQEAGYAASVVVMETCAFLDVPGGISVDAVMFQSMAVQSSKEELIDYLEKHIYDSVMAEVKKRRVKDS